ncbi:hypothetical protein BG006_009468 [Podila minutissima]|uniref:Uncharacterized protein n=1 Tax=Podila minutissima TaxID=64525 RepID=A0A9P5VJC7_9FUNG|nr:hypothetical protein BG006_009468 [Podila minutissima]
MGKYLVESSLTELRTSTRLFSLTMAIKEMIYAIPTLRRLWVDTGLDRERIKLLLSVLPETIEDTTFMVDSIYDEQTNVPKVEEGAMPSLPALRMTAFKGCYEYGGNSVLWPLLSACYKLISFETTTTQPFCDESCRAVLANLGIFLERINPLDLRKGDQSVDSEIMTTISLSAGYMKGINLQHCKQTERFTVAAIMDNCEFLEYLNVSGDGYGPQSKIRSQDLQTILCKAPRLMIFITISNKITSGHFDPFLDAEDILGLEWAATSLMEFCRRIVVSRTDQHRQPGQSEHDKLTLDLEHSRAIQRQIYARLTT